MQILSIVIAMNPLPSVESCSILSSTDGEKHKILILWKISIDKLNTMLNKILLILALQKLVVKILLLPNHLAKQYFMQVVVKIFNTSK
jgi:hypothetical protein